MTEENVALTGVPLSIDASVISSGGIQERVFVNRMQILAFFSRTQVRESGLIVDRLEGIAIRTHIPTKWVGNGGDMSFRNFIINYMFDFNKEKFDENNEKHWDFILKIFQPGFTRFWIQVFSEKEFSVLMELNPDWDLKE
jgi:hypothetical protein